MKMIKGVVSTGPVLIVSETVLNFANGSAGGATFDIISNGAWNISDDMAWCTVIPSGDGSGNYDDVHVSVTSGTDRTGEITIQGQGITRIIEVVQGAPV